ncbi:hypothetical protein GLV89_09300 [Halomonas alkaliantarctica]|nr:hypothetical protein [Halomonas alkaliantarctica]
MQVSERHILEVERAITLFNNGVDPSLIELSEKAVFPILINAAPPTARKSRVTGILLGRPAPDYVKHGRTVRYRLSTILSWIDNAEIVNNSAQALILKKMNKK